MEKLNYVKYAVIAAGIIVSAAFYVLCGDGGALLGAAGDGIMLEADSGSSEGSGSAVISEDGGLTQAFKSQLEDIVRGAVRDELTAICEEGYLELALSEAAEYAAAEAEARKDMVNINTASLEELMTLTGIGEKRAGDIIAYRESTGGFSDISQLMEVSGIKQSSYDRIKDKIYV